MLEVGIGHHTQVRNLLNDHFKDKEITGIEVGTSSGDLTQTLLLFVPTLKKIYTVDPWKYLDTNEFRRWYPQDVQDEGKRLAVTRLFQWGDRCTIIPISSDEAATILPQVDFAWIDGDHTESQVKKDIENYYAKVKDGGVFGGHDLHCTPELIKGMFGDRLIEGYDDTWWVIK
jgi:hypothetical protein